MPNDSTALTAEEWQRAKPLVTMLARLPRATRAEALAEALPADSTLQAKLAAFLDVVDRASAPFDLVGPAEPRDLARAPIEAGASLEPGDMVGRYRVIRPIGAGGMGQVCLAEDTRLGRQVALKEMRTPPSEDPSRFGALREARAIAALEHAGIASLHDVLERPGGLTLVMEYVAGRPLSDVVADGPLPVEDALQITAQIADAIAYAHEHGVVHCDIKPANVHLDAGGRAKVLDFGLARLLAEGGWRDDRGAGPLFGTIPYMAPERLVKGSSLPSCDIYSLGVLLFELLTGRLPFQGSDDAQFFFDALTTPPPAPTSLVPHLPREVDRIVERALAKRPQARFQSARELAEAARQLLASLERTPVAPQLVTVSPERETEERRPRRSDSIVVRRLQIALVGAALTLALTTLVGFISTRVYDLAFGRTSRFNDDGLFRWTVQGASALAGPATYIFIAMLALGIVASLLRLVAPRVVAALASWAARVTDATPALLAEGVLLASALSLSWFFWRFRTLIFAVVGWGWGSGPWPDDLLPLRPSNNAEHVQYRMWSTLILVASGAAWLVVLRRAAARAKAVGLFTTGTGAAILLAAVFLWSMPHRLVFQSKRPRVVSDGQPCYVIGTDRDESLVFCPLAEPPERRRVVRTSAVAGAARNAPLEAVFGELDRFLRRRETRP